MPQPLITILMPCYNVGQFLPKCLDSVLAQTYSNLQVVLVDDGSSDNTFAVMQQYAAKDSRIEIYTQKNHGVAFTRNQLLDKIKGEYVLFVDSDDWIEQDMVEFLYNQLSENDADIAMCGMVVNDNTPRKSFSQKTLSREDTIKAFLYHTEVKGSLCDKLLKSSLLHDERFHNEISYGEDALFCWHIMQHADKMVLTDRHLYHYRMNYQSISHQTFGAKKLSGSLVWQTISEETAKWWPQFLGIAQARWGMEDMYLLRQAGQSNYKKDENIADLQKNVRRFMPMMKSSGLLKGKEVFNARMMSIWYGYSKLYHHLNRLKQRLK